MSEDFAMDSQRVAGQGEEVISGPSVPHPTPLPGGEGAGGPGGEGADWREHVRELRTENARRRKENQELRAQLAALGDRLREAETAQAAAAERAGRDAARLAAVHRRLKEAEVARLAREALREAASRQESGTAEGRSATRVVDLARAQRLLDWVPAPVDLDADLTVDDEGRVALAAAAAERLKGFAEAMVDLIAVEPRVAPPPVGGEPPSAAGPALGPVPNSWDPDGQRSRTGQAQAALRQTAAANATVLDGLAQL